MVQSAQYNVYIVMIDYRHAMTGGEERWLLSPYLVPNTPIQAGAIPISLISEYLVTRRWPTGSEEM